MASSSAAAGPRALVWFKQTDLRIADHEPLVKAHQSDASSVAHLFVFDPFWFGTGRQSGLPKMAHYRAKFLLEAVADLRQVRAFI